MTPIEALQAALAGEHAAVHVLGLLGAQTSASAHPGLFAQLDAAYAEHRRRRDQLTVLIHGRGETPVAAEVGYDPPSAIGSAEQVTAAALLIEQRTTMLYGQLVESTAESERRWAITALDAGARRQRAFGGAPQRLPGLA